LFEMNLFFQEQGEGTSILLIHGFCETHEIWNGFNKKLSRYGRVISIDLPGFGMSPLAAGPVSIDLIAGIILAWLKERKIEAPVLIGHSLGGYVALAMAEIDPAFCKKLVLFHSSAYADTDEKRANRNKVIEFVGKNGVEPFIQTFVPTLFYDKEHPRMDEVRKICNGTPTNTLIEYTKAMRDRPSREGLLRNFCNPILILAGDKDEIIPLDISEKMASLNPKITIFHLSNTGHMGMVEAEAEAIETIAGFAGIRPT
jgi:pimeloyl-ACP methyl ester carboxylesterase